MDLSGLKWPVIILVVVGIGWLASSPGVNFMYNQFTKAQVGQDAEKDASDESGLTKLAGYTMMLWQYEKSASIMQTAIDRYGPNGKDYYYNNYRMVKCLEKLERYQEAYNLLQQLIAVDAPQYDERVANLDNLRLRAQKLKEVHELQ